MWNEWIDSISWRFQRDIISCVTNMQHCLPLWLWNSAYSDLCCRKAFITMIPWPFGKRTEYFTETYSLIIVFTGSILTIMLCSFKSRDLIPGFLLCVLKGTLPAALYQHYKQSSHKVNAFHFCCLWEHRVRGGG